jgi:hypothetical protein
MLLRTLVLSVALVFGLCGQAAAWGKAGHKIVCMVAFRMAAPATQTEIRRLMGLDADFPSFEESCSWPDQPRQRGSEHIVHVPRTAKRLVSDCPMADRCVVTAIAKDLAVLRSKSAGDRDKLASLKFLAHWVGDIHQPLHAAFKDDRVGTEISVVGECAGTMHAMWDTCLVTKTLGRDAAQAATGVANSVTPASRKRWSMSRPRDWANESFAIATNPRTKYCIRRGGACERPTGSVVVDDAYLRDNAAIIRERLARAAVRLARLLDYAFAKSKPNGT